MNKVRQNNPLIIIALDYDNETDVLDLCNKLSPAECRLKYIDYDGKPKDLKAEGLLATCIQHEVDHLNGILFIDYLSKLKKTMIIKKLVKQKKSLERIVV